ncbi:reverse transcriptase domain-containing protein [Tanacetum coccineum]
MLLLTAPIPRFKIGESSAAAAARQPGSTMARRVDHSFVDTMDTRVQYTKRSTMAAIEEAQEDRAAVRAEIEILRRERLAYEQESIETRQALARSEAYIRALEARIRVLENQAYRHEWQRQDTDDCAIEHIMRTQALEDGAHVDTLEDIGYDCMKSNGNWKKEYAGTLPLCNKCKFHHVGLCAERCNNCKLRGHQVRDCRISGPKAKPRPLMAKLKVEVTCYECGELGHYKRDCLIVKLQNRVDKYWKGKARGDSIATTSNINI